MSYRTFLIQPWHICFPHLSVVFKSSTQFRLKCFLNYHSSEFKVLYICSKLRVLNRHYCFVALSGNMRRVVCIYWCGFVGMCCFIEYRLYLCTCVFLKGLNTNNFCLCANWFLSNEIILRIHKDWIRATVWAL